MINISQCKNHTEIMTAIGHYGQGRRDGFVSGFIAACCVLLLLVSIVSLVVSERTRSTIGNLAISEISALFQER